MQINQNTDYLSAADLDNNTLLARLLIAQQQIREVLMCYRIPSGNICAMARLSRNMISNSNDRAKFLENLIELQYLGIEAKLRNLLGEAEMTSSGLLSMAASEATALRNYGPQTRPTVVVPTIAPATEIESHRKRVFPGISKEFFESLNVRSV